MILIPDVVVPATLSCLLSIQPFIPVLAQAVYPAAAAAAAAAPESNPAQSPTPAPAAVSDESDPNRVKPCIMVDDSNPSVAPHNRAADLLVNGSFEKPELSQGAWAISASIDGWRTVNGPGIEVQNRAAGAPLDGQQLAELDSHASSTIAQDVRTVPGQRYLLRVAVSPRPGTNADDNIVGIRWGGNVVDTISAGASPSNTMWQRRHYVVEARERTTTLELFDAGVSNSVGSYVDTVSLMAVCRSDAAVPGGSASPAAASAAVPYQCKKFRGKRCYWKENSSGHYCWVPADHAGNKTECSQLDTCDGGSGAGDACYKYADCSDCERYPW